MGVHVGEHAVVLGASMAGLLAARVLADSYSTVTVVDRDELALETRHRRGVPQGHQFHGLLARGQQVLEELFPGLTEQLRADGVPAGDVLGDSSVTLSGHRFRRVRTGLVVLSASRPLLEHHVRARVRELPGVSFRVFTDVVGLVGSRDRHVGSRGSRLVTGVRVRRRAEGSAAELLDADLVVDATGRGSRLPGWLEELGCQRPSEERVTIGLGYTTSRYRLPPDALGEDLAVLYAPTPQQPRGGVLARIEDGQWLLTLSGVLGDHPPTDPDGSLAFVRSLGPSEIQAAIRHAELLDGPVAHRFPASVRRRYERLADVPDGLVALGDSVCSFNPVYGQGMSVAALEALVLRRHLQRGPLRPRDVYRDIARVVDTAWEMTVTSDLAFPGVEGHRTTARRVAGSYVSRLHAAAEHDTALGTAFMRVAGLMDPPSLLLRPRVVVSVLRPRRSRPSGTEQTRGAATRLRPRPLLRWSAGGIMRSPTSPLPRRTR